MARDDEPPCVRAGIVGTSDEEEAVGWTSDADAGEPVLTYRSRRHLTILGTRPRRPQPPNGNVRAVSDLSHSSRISVPVQHRRNLRRRKLSQIHPYTVEALRYQRELYENDWEDAVVSQPGLHRKRFRERDSDSWVVPDDQADDTTQTEWTSPPEYTAQAERRTQVEDNALTPHASRMQLVSPVQSNAATSSSTSSSRSLSVHISPAGSESPSSGPDTLPAQSTAALEESDSPATSSEDSTDYERRFRVLKRMMPAHMARACIDDLRAMRHGDVDHPGVSSERPHHVHASSPVSDLQPGQSRRRIRTTHRDSPPIPLLSDVSAELSDEEATEDHSPSPQPRPRESDLRWWTISKQASSPVREGDAIDRMLSRTETRRRRRLRVPSGELGHGRHARNSAIRHRGFSNRTERIHSIPATAPAWIQSSVEPASHGQSRVAPSASQQKRPDSGIYVVEQKSRFDGLPTRRGDLTSHVRLPYVPHSQAVCNVAQEMHSSPALSTSTAPRPVPRSTYAPAFLSKTSVATASHHSVPLPVSTLHIPTEWQNAPQEWHDELQELLTWDGVRRIQLDYGIVPPTVGLGFAADTDLARGRLHALLRVSSAATIQSSTSYRGYEQALDVSMGFDEIARAIVPLTDHLDEHHRSTRDLFYFLGSWFSWQAATRSSIHAGVHAIQEDVACVPAVVTAVSGATFNAQAACDALCAWAQDLLHLPHSPEVVLWILWFRVDLFWRAMHVECTSVTEVSIMEAAYPLVLRLLSMGISRVVESYISVEHVRDTAAEMWVCVIHVLQAIDAQAFWDVLEAALNEWLGMSPSSLLVDCERIWYTIFAVCALSHFHASTGMAGYKSDLQAHWLGIQRLMMRMKLRFNEQVEQAAPRALLQRRDAYIHLLIHRCFLLHSRWHWSLEHADHLLTHFFDIFNAHRLADLPSEVDHDFAPFLRRFDMGLLYSEPTGTAYHKFLQLLGQASSALQVGPDAQRRLARLFSRMTPVRVMAFSCTQPPTSFEFAMLFNHYSLVMLFLYFEPQSAVQRLRQIRSFLPFARADRSSQIACIRAVVYAGVLFRHHRLDISPIVAWLVDVFHALRSPMSIRDVSEDEPFGARRAKQAARETTRMMAVLLRSVQHLITHATMHSGGVSHAYPPLGLLHPAWTHELIESGELPMEVANEVLNLIRVYLEARARQLQPVSIDTDDDDEFADDAAWLTDPGLGALLGEETPQPPLDTQLADQLQTHLSPALFHWLSRGTSNSPHVSRPSHWLPHSEAMPLERLIAHAEDDACLTSLVSVWAACAYVLVYHRRRDWSGYLTLGQESWKRLSDSVRKRDVAVQFVVCMAQHEPSAVERNASECIAIWFQCIAAYRVTQQHVLTHLLVHHACDLFAGVNVYLSRSTDPYVVKAEFSTQRLSMIQCVLQQMQSSGTSLGFVIQCVSALLSSIRAYAESVRDPVYWTWCKTVLAAMNEQLLSEAVLRGVRTELHSTDCYLQAC